MRTLKRQPKTLVPVQIPRDLLAFLVEVNPLILSGHDLATTESDDLLQSDCAYGGLTHEGAQLYKFTYFPESGVRHKWHFALLATEISEIVSNERTKLELWFCQSDDCHSAFQNFSDTCFFCDYVDEEAF